MFQFWWPIVFRYVEFLFLHVVSDSLLSISVPSIIWPFIFLRYRFVIEVTFVFSQSAFLMIERSSDDNLLWIGFLEFTSPVTKTKFGELSVSDFYVCLHIIAPTEILCSLFSGLFYRLSNRRTHSVPALRCVLLCNKLFA